MITKGKVDKVEVEWKRYRRAVLTANRNGYGLKETGAIRRASMDLTRVLAELRRPQDRH